MKKLRLFHVMLAAALIFGFWGMASAGMPPRMNHRDLDVLFNGMAQNDVFLWFR